MCACGHARVGMCMCVRRQPGMSVHMSHAVSLVTLAGNAGQSFQTVRCQERCDLGLTPALPVTTICRGVTQRSAAPAGIMIQTCRQNGEQRNPKPNGLDKFRGCNAPVSRSPPQQTIGVTPQCHAVATANAYQTEVSRGVGGLCEGGDPWNL